MVDRKRYEEKKEARINRFHELADKADKKSSALYKESREMASVIPLGQPILVGHHSEKSDRNYRNRIHKKMDRSCEEAAKAEHYRGKAAAAESNRAISSDDPDAVIKLQKKLDKRIELQEFYKGINKIVRKKKLSDDEKVKELIEAFHISEAQARDLLKPDHCCRIGIASYQLQNNNANINRLKKRIESLKAQPAESKEIEHDGFKVRENADINRIQLIFPGKPAESIRKILKSNGFRWSRFEQAWQRHLNNNGRYAVERVIQLFGNNVSCETIA